MWERVIFLLLIKLITNKLKTFKKINELKCQEKIVFHYLINKLFYYHDNFYCILEKLCQILICYIYEKNK